MSAAVVFVAGRAPSAAFRERAHVFHPEGGWRRRGGGRVGGRGGRRGGGAGRGRGELGAGSAVQRAPHVPGARADSPPSHGHALSTQDATTPRQPTKPAPSHPSRPPQYGDAPEKAYGKRQRLRQAGLWLVDPPDYYRRADGHSAALLTHRTSSPPLKTPPQLPLLHSPTLSPRAHETRAPPAP